METFENCHVEWRDLTRGNRRRKFFTQIHEHCKVVLDGQTAIITLENGKVVEQNVKRKGFTFKTMGTVKL